MSRTITVVTSKFPNPINFSAANGLTWGQVEEIINENSDIRSTGGTSGMKAILRSNKNPLESSDAVFPDGDQAIFLTSNKKIKSGSNNEEVIEAVNYFKNSVNASFDKLVQALRSSNVISNNSDLDKFKREMMENEQLED